MEHAVLPTPRKNQFVLSNKRNSVGCVRLFKLGIDVQPGNGKDGATKLFERQKFKYEQKPKIELYYVIANYLKLILFSVRFNKRV